ncbi:hypothetical protein ECANGB1_1711 [Enterospora canceri]|uniref:Uncharacterized protein n=1 Tax=Enterospora canceri TaxID=1081671 RepID=A0A1Y1S984_9MICR|nr:hypothetical protein ECANGB1_1711 [Enterospora canceri]
MEFEGNGIIFYKERMNRISQFSDAEACINIDKLVICMRDDNPEVRKCVIERLRKIKESKIFDLKLLERSCFLVCDRDSDVRLCYAKLLHRFRNISCNDKEKLFDKNELGLFIYAIEDEDIAVKNEFIKALEHFLVPEAVNFLIDMLNEDSEIIRMTVSKVLKKATKIKNEEGMVIKCTDSQIKFILLCLEENNTVIQHNVLTVLSHLYQNSEKLFFALLRNRTLNDELKINKLLKMVENNTGFFLEYLNKNVDYTFDNNNTLKDEKYFGDLIILKAVLKENKNMICQISGKIKEDLKFLEFKLRSKNTGEIDFDKVECDLIENKRLIRSKCERMCRLEIDDSVIQCEYDENMNVADFIEKNFRVQDTIKYSPVAYFIKNNQMIVPFGELIKLFYTGNYDKSIAQFKNTFYMIVGPTEVEKYLNRPLIFDLTVHYDEKNTSTLLRKLKVVVTDGTRSLVYPIKKILTVLLEEENLEKLECFIAVDLGGNILKLGQSITVAIKNGTGELV